MSIAERIHQARGLRGLSLRALAEKVSVSHAAIAKYESGEDTPSSGALLRLATALEVPLDFFFRASTVGEIQPAFRKRKALEGARLHHVEAEIRDSVERYLELEAIRRPQMSPGFMPPQGFPRAVRDMEEVERAADDLRDAWQLGRDPIQDLTEVLEERGIKVVEVAGEDKFDACTFEIAVDGARGRVVALRSAMPADRHRFTLAHELGHLLLEAPELDEERVANRFAGALLAPRERVIEELGTKRSRISPFELHALKHKYGLSMQAWVYRAHDLGVINDSTNRALHAWFRKNHVHRAEPGEELPRERPSRFFRLVLQALEEGQIGRQRASELLNRSLDQTLGDFAKEHPGIEAVLGR